jgi:hypothetical protein
MFNILFSLYHYSSAFDGANLIVWEYNEFRFVFVGAF